MMTGWALRNFYYFDKNRLEWVDSGKSEYYVFLPVTDITRDAFVIHESVNNGSRWTISHKDSSGALGQGLTKGDAIRDATNNILRLGKNEFNRRTKLAMLGINGIDEPDIEQGLELAFQ